jgi:hypothetical protein
MTSPQAFPGQPVPSTTLRAKSENNGIVSNTTDNGKMPARLDRRHPLQASTHVHMADAPMARSPRGDKGAAPIGIRQGGRWVRVRWVWKQ